MNFYKKFLVLFSILILILGVFFMANMELFAEEYVPAPTLTLTATPQEMFQFVLDGVPQHSASITWSTTNADSCVASTNWKGDAGWVGTSSSTPVKVYPTTSTSYSMTCYNSNFVSVTKNVTVDVTNIVANYDGNCACYDWPYYCGAIDTGSGCQVKDSREVNTVLIGCQNITTSNLPYCSATPSPTVAFTSTSSNVASGGSTVLKWSSVNATTCTASGDWSGNKALVNNEGETISNITANKRFTLTCSGANNKVASATVAVTVTTPPATLTLNDIPNEVTVTKGGPSVEYNISAEKINVAMGVSFDTKAGNEDLIASTIKTGTETSTSRPGILTIVADDAPASTTGYPVTISASGRNATTDEVVTTKKSFIVKVLPMPTPSMIATPTPSCVTPSVATASTVLTWNAYPNATSYTVKDGSNVIYTGTATTYTHSSLVKGSSHSYSITATTPSGTSPAFTISPNTTASGDCVGSLVVDDCNILLNASTCQPKFTWSVTTGVSGASTEVRKTATPPVIEFNTASGTNLSGTAIGNVTKGYSLVHNGGVLVTDTATGSCVTGTTWDQTTNKCITPPSTYGSITSVDTCFIPANASTCAVGLTWSVTNKTTGATIEVKRNRDTSGNVISTNNTVSSNDSGSNFSVSIYYSGPSGENKTTFTLYHNTTSLSNVIVSATCEAGTIWNGTKCVTYVPSSTGNLDITPTSCTIQRGLDNCSAKAYWDTTGATNPNLYNKTSGVILSNEANKSITPGFPLVVVYPGRTYELRDGVTVLDTVSVTTSCASGDIWDTATNKCIAPPTTAGTISVSNCAIQLNESTCIPYFTWNVTSPLGTTEIKKESDNTVIFNDNHSGTNRPGTAVGPGSNTYKLYNNGVYLVTSNTSTASCASGTTWDTTTGKCIIPTTPTGEISATTCTIGEGASTCNSTLNWSITSPISGANSAVTKNRTNAGVAVSTPPDNLVSSNLSGSGVSVSVYFGGVNQETSTTFYLFHNGVQLKTATITPTCAPNTQWNTTSKTCVATSTNTTGWINATVCTIPTNQSTTVCPVTFTWDIINPVVGAPASVVTRNRNVWGEEVSNLLASNSPSKTDSTNIYYGGNNGETPTVLFLYYNGALLDSVSLAPACAPGATWNGSGCSAPTTTVTGWIVSSGCYILPGESTCNAHTSWGVRNPSGGSSAVTRNRNSSGVSVVNEQVSTLSSGTADPTVYYSLAPGGGSTKFFLYYDGNELASVEVAPVCYDSSWDTTLNKCIAVEPPPPALSPTSSLEVNPTSIMAGGSATLSWSSTDTHVCIGTNFNTGFATQGSVSVSPTVTTTYTVMCVGAGGQTYDTAILQVTTPDKKPIYKEQ